MKFIPIENISDKKNCGEVQLLEFMRIKITMMII